MELVVESRESGFRSALFTTAFIALCNRQVLTLSSSESPLSVTFCCITSHLKAEWFKTETLISHYRVVEQSVLFQVMLVMALELMEGPNGLSETVRAGCWLGALLEL